MLARYDVLVVIACLKTSQHAATVSNISINGINNSLNIGINTGINGINNTLNIGINTDNNVGNTAVDSGTAS
jgi:hypothetical protein